MRARDAVGGFEEHGVQTVTGMLRNFAHYLKGMLRNIQGVSGWHTHLFLCNPLAPIVLPAEWRPWVCVCVFMCVCVCVCMYVCVSAPEPMQLPVSAGNVCCGLLYKLKAKPPAEIGLCDLLCLGEKIALECVCIGESESFCRRTVRRS